MAKITNTVVKLERPKINRPGVHSKSQTSNLKSSKNYKKKNVGQGR
jgi:hypothetical protein